MRQFIKQAKAMSKKRGVWHRYIYTNHAASWQDPMAGYDGGGFGFYEGGESENDPNGVF
jgi:hypothetical protein